MNTIQKSAEDLIISTSERLEKLGYSVSNIEKAQYHFEFVVSNENEKAKLLVYFGKKGVKPVIQGNNKTRLYNSLYGIVNGEPLFSEVKAELIEPESYIGTDESGKGDYFGPLVIAGVFADRKDLTVLKDIGVRDSKTLSDLSIKKLANEIKLILKDKFNILVINPPKYNELYTKIKNVNRLLGWAHARVIENILTVHPAREAISDKFGDEDLIVNSLSEKGRTIKLYQETKAERYSAVAAASILARNKFNEWFEYQLKNEQLKLPKGASSSVNETAKRIVEQYGFDYLARVAKIHFKITDKIS